MAQEIQITPDAPIQSGNLITFRIRFTDEDGAAIDISAATSSAIKFVDPTAAFSTVTAAFESDGSDGYITATFSPAFAGDWRVQGSAIIAGQEKHTGRGKFSVEPNLS